jgi:predicted nucleotidyltransferase
MARTYPDDLLIGGAYGSTARGTDTEWSDLELLFVVRAGSRAQGHHFIYRGIAVGYRVIEETALEEILTNPSLK